MTRRHSGSQFIISSSMARIGDHTTASEAAPAAWVAAGLRGFGETVVSVVPTGFRAYARIFRPAERLEGEDRTPVSWSRVVEANGRIAHRAMQWPSLVGSWRLVHGSGRQPGVWDAEPAEGSLPREVAIVLAEVLVGQTATPERCWFGVWEGFGGLVVPAGGTASFAIPQRRMLLLAGPVRAVVGRHPL